jgi:hypothetical protein
MFDVPRNYSGKTASAHFTQREILDIVLRQIMGINDIDKLDIYQVGKYILQLLKEGIDIKHKILSSIGM